MNALYDSKHCCTKVIPAKYGSAPLASVLLGDETQFCRVRSLEIILLLRQSVLPLSRPSLVEEDVYVYFPNQSDWLSISVILVY